MPALAKDKMRTYRARLRAQGLKPIQIWVPDSTSPQFQAEARRQSLLVARRRKSEKDALDLIDATFDWSEE